MIDFQINARRDFLKSLLVAAGSFTLLKKIEWIAAIQPAAAAETFADHADHFDVVSQFVKYPGPGATLAGYLAKPNSGGVYPAIILLPADCGLDDNIRQMAIRYAKQGFVALVVDPLSRRGGTACFASSFVGGYVGDAEFPVRGTWEALPEAQLAADLDSSFAYLRSNRSVQERRIEVLRIDRGVSNS